MDSSSVRRFVVVGAGGVGSVLAGFLARAGVPVAIVARRAHVQAVHERGLQVVGEGGATWTAPLRAEITVADCGLRSDDVVMCTAKSYDTQAIVESVAAALPSGPAAFVCAQNGVRNEAVAAARLPRVYGAMARFRGRLLEPGRVYAPGTHHLTFGRYPDGTDDLIGEVARRCAEAGIGATTTPDVMRLKWSKLVANCANAVYAVANVQVDQVWGDAELGLLVNRIWAEAEAVLRAAGIAFEPVPPVPPPSASAARRGPGAIEFYGSTWDDLAQRKGRTEVDWFNGEIVRLGRDTGRPTPLNALLLRACTEMTAQRADPGRFTVAQLLAMADATQKVEVDGN